MKANLATRIAAISLAALLCACSTAPERPVKKSSGPELTETTFSELPAVESERWRGALEALRHSCSALAKNETWRTVCANAETADGREQEFFETNFTPWRLEVVSYEDGEPVRRQTSGLMTGYFEPLLYGSRTRQGPFVHPIYGVPDDLIIVDLASLYPELKGMRLRGKLEGRRLVPYDERAVIQKRTDLEKWAIAWVDDPIAAFFLQVQGSGRILLPDGSYMRVGFADQNGYRYRSIGNWLVKHSHLKPHELSMQKIKEWASDNPLLINQALAQNPSYIFFEERKGDPSLGPVGAQGVPLTPGASVAVDPHFWKLGTPFIVSVRQERPDLAFTRPVIAQDTGGAIRGPIRFDYFWGFGDKAGESAGRQKSSVEAWVLVPKGADPELVRR